MEELKGLTNFEKWRLYTDGLTSPDSYINFGFYFMIAASLQRRVWLPPKHKPIFINIYGGLIGEPGIGKGLVITEVSKFLRHHKLQDPYENNARIINGKPTGNIESVDRTLIETAAHADYLSGKTEEDRTEYHKSKYGSNEKPLLIPMAADATSYEALVTAIAKALRRKNYYDWDGEKQIPRIYTHSSVCFCLEEFSSIFKKKAEDTIRFLQITFDCGDYKKDTKTQGVDKIQRCCVNLIGGATPDFMRKLFRDEIGDEGLKSRCIFIFAHKDRKTSAFIPELNDAQRQCEQDLLAHIKKLSDLYGQVTVTPEAYKFIEDWWLEAQTMRPNINEKLKHYYARKKVHVLKLAAAHHFAESTEMVLHKEDCQWAVNFLDSIEPLMHHALIAESKNPYYKISGMIMRYLSEAGGKSERELLAKFWEELPGSNPVDGLTQTLNYLISTSKIVTSTPKGETIYSVLKQSKSTVTESSETSPYSE